MTIASVNPATGQILRTFTPLSEPELDARLQCAADAFARYRRVALSDRLRMLLRAAEILEAEKEKFGRLMVMEMGKTLKAAVEEAAKCAWGCRYYGEQAERFLADELVETSASRSFVTYQPLGPILAIMPWNFPFWQVFRFAAPALAAGNVALLKHASNVPQCALAIQDIFRRAGFPEGCFQTLLIETDRVRRVIEDPRIVAATLTGSTDAGSHVASVAGKQIKKTVLELGGSDACLVLADAGLAEAVDTCVASRLINAGQSCIAAKRFVVVEPVREEFERRFVSRMASVRVGDPLADDSDIGPLARPDLRDDLHRQVTESVARGASLLLGGEVPAGPGVFYPPTVLADVGPGMPAYDEELFGPVAAIIPVGDEAEAIRVANDSRYGLGAAVFTREAMRGERIARDALEAGSCFVNAFVRSDPRLPFGRDLAPSMLHKHRVHNEAVARISWCIRKRARAGDSSMTAFKASSHSAVS
jgi:succinate-semialdehyde dehydrogenase / glutarate-semialdehyde dehydrogenase